MKEVCGLNPKTAVNRHVGARKQPCPEEKQDDLRKAFEHFRLI